jgi:hypothetical protein
MIISIPFHPIPFTSRSLRVNTTIPSRAIPLCYPTYRKALRNPASPSIVSLNDAPDDERRLFLTCGAWSKREDDSAGVDVLGKRPESPSL